MGTTNSLNYYASRIVHIINQPDNLSLKERVKDMIKDYYAKFICDSITRNGIKNAYKISLILEMEPVLESKQTSTIVGRVSYSTFVSKSKLPKTLNIKNDAPLTQVMDIEGSSNIVYTYTPYNIMRMKRISSTLLPTGGINTYSINKNKLYVCRKFNNNFNSEKTITNVEVEGLWENPEEVIGFYMTDDNQDLDLPFPREMMIYVVSSILKTEFNIIPKDTEISE